MAIAHTPMVIMVLGRGAQVTGGMLDGVITVIEVTIGDHALFVDGNKHACPWVFAIGFEGSRKPGWVQECADRSSIRETS